MCGDDITSTNTTVGSSRELVQFGVTVEAMASGTSSVAYMLIVIF